MDEAEDEDEEAIVVRSRRWTKQKMNEAEDEGGIPYNKRTYE